MRVLFTTTGYPGHVLPLVPFARSCLEAGDEVYVAGPRSRAAVVEQQGLAFLDCGGPSDEDVAHLVASAAGLRRQEGHARMMTEAFGRLGPRSLVCDLLQVVGAWRPDVVVRESHELAGALAAERHGVPHVSVGLGLASTEDETLALTAGPVEELRAQLGLPCDAERLRARPGTRWSRRRSTTPPGRP